MTPHQIAMAVVNDPAAADLVRIGVNHFLNDGHWDGAVHRLLTPVMYELKKPIYEGVQIPHGFLWDAARGILDWELDRLSEQRAR
jgi:hypothetical protein